MSKVNEGTINNVQNGGIGRSKTHKNFRPNKKIFKKNNSNKKKKRIGPVFIVERKVTISENANS